MMNNDAERMLESGIPPDWFPLDKKIDFQGKRRDLLNSKTLDDLREDVKAIIKMRREHFADPNYLKFEYRPGIINGLPDTVGHDLAILARYLYAAALGEEEGLPLLIGNDYAKAATKGKKFNHPGRGHGPIRKWIAHQLKKNQKMKNAELWDTFKETPLQGWEVIEPRYFKGIGVSLNGPSGNNMGYRRFCTVASEERGKLKG